jgi:AcrR family transcriptional regulator
MPARNRPDPLTRDEIVEAALRVTQRDGLGGLTMRAAAAELGVAPLAIYYHVKDKDLLVELVVAAVSSRQVPLRLDPDGWEASLRRHLLSVWEELARYPGLGSHMVNLPMLGTTPRSIADGVRFFEDAGFPPVTARLAWSFALTYIHGRLSVDARLHGHATPDVKIEGLRSHHYVEFGVEAVVAGLRALLEGDADPLDVSGSAGRSRGGRAP